MYLVCCVVCLHSVLCVHSVWCCVYLLRGVVLKVDGSEAQAA